MTLQERVKELLPKWLGRPFNIGRIDCVQLLWNLYPALPRQHGTLNQANYVERWRQNKQETLDMLEDYIAEHTEMIDNQEKAIGDIIITAEPAVMGVWLGGSKLLVVLEQKGALPIPLWTQDYITLRVKR